ncbi:MAG: hypothetical protein WAV47_05745 [Blastocatellia bacterium]
MNLSVETLIILLIVGGIVGVIAQKITGYSRGGCLTSIVIGFIGALIGTWAIKQFRLPELYILKIGHTSFPVLWAIIGAAMLVALVGLVTRRRFGRFV